MGNPNWAHWFDEDMEQWSPEQAIALSLAVDPRGGVPAHLEKHFFERLEVLHGAMERDEVLLSIVHGKVDRFSFAFWASQKKGWDLPEELVERAIDGHGSEGDDRDLAAAVAQASEDVYNGRPIDWRYWLVVLPMLAPAEAARLMCALDPDLYAELPTDKTPLSELPTKNDVREQCTRARDIERAADKSGVVSMKAGDWMTWAEGLGFSVHTAFRVALDKALGGEFGPRSSNGADGNSHRGAAVSDRSPSIALPRSEPEDHQIDHSWSNESITHPSPRLQAKARELAQQIGDGQRNSGVLQVTIRGVAAKVAAELAALCVEGQRGPISASSARTLLTGWSYKSPKGR